MESRVLLLMVLLVTRANCLEESKPNQYVVLNHRLLFVLF